MDKQKPFLAIRVKSEERRVKNPLVFMAIKFFTLLLAFHSAADFQFFTLHLNSSLSRCAGRRLGLPPMF